MSVTMTTMSVHCGEITEWSRLTGTSPSRTETSHGNERRGTRCDDSRAGKKKKERKWRSSVGKSDESWEGISVASVLCSSACHVCVAKEKMHVSSRRKTHGVTSCSKRWIHRLLNTSLSVKHTHWRQRAYCPTRQHVNDHDVSFYVHSPCMWANLIQTFCAFSFPVQHRSTTKFTAKCNVLFSITHVCPPSSICLSVTHKPTNILFSLGGLFILSVQSKLLQQWHISLCMTQWLRGLKDSLIFYYFKQKQNSTALFVHGSQSWMDKMLPNMTWNLQWLLHYNKKALNGSLNPQRIINCIHTPPFLLNGAF